MREDVVPYEGPSQKVIVYDTWANERTIHFGVMLPYEETNESELNRRALAAAKSFLTAIGADPTWVSLSGCSRCHVDELDRFKGRLWHLTREGVCILAGEGCPKPSARK